MKTARENAQFFEQANAASQPEVVKLFLLMLLAWNSGLWSVVSRQIQFVRS
jgi:hypothetical protein